MMKPGTGTTEAFVIWVLSYIFFILFLANNLSASHDSINYLYHIVKGEHLFHQHHLLYHFFCRQWLNVWHAAFPSVQFHYIAESFTALWGSGVLSVCYLLLRNRFMLTKWLSAAGVCVIAFSYGTWFYSVNVEVYAAPIFFILVSLYLMSGRPDEKAIDLKVALTHSAAILFHQANVLFIVVAVTWLYLAFRSRFRAVLARYILVLFSVTGIVYFIVGWFVEGHHDIVSFSNWIMGYTVGHDYWQPLSSETPFKVLTGFVRAFIGAQFVFQIPPVNEFLSRSFSSHGLQDEIFLARNMSGLSAWLITSLAILVGAIVLIMVFRFAARLREMRLHMNTIRLMLLTLLVYSLFFTFWVPEILEFWILQMIIVWLLIAGMLPLVRFPFRIGNFTGLAMLAGCMFIINYFGSIKWLRSFDNDWYYQQVNLLPATKDDLVIITDKWILKDYVRYFKGAEVIATDERVYTPDEIREMITETKMSGGKVYRNVLKDAGGWEVIQSY